MHIIKCKKCGKEFGYNIWGSVYPGGKDWEEAACPFCGKIGYSEITSQCISVYKIDSEKIK